MTPAIATPRSNERILASLLRLGTLLASSLIGFGMLATALQRVGAFPALGGHSLVGAGVALFILLPILRVGMMLLLFLRERDLVFAAIAALVLAIIGTGIAMELFDGV